MYRIPITYRQPARQPVGGGGIFRFFLVLVGVLWLAGCMASPLQSGERRHRHRYQQPAGRDALNRLQKAVTAYMRDNDHPDSGLAYEASFAFAGAGRPLAVGGTGFGVAALVAGVERGWLDRAETAERIVRMGTFLRDNVDRKALHGAFPRWLYPDNAGTAAGDAGADLIETAFLIQGLLIARAYFDAAGGTERELREIVDTLWREVEWDWFTAGKDEGLHWHWRGKDGFHPDGKNAGAGEGLVAYVLALGSPTHSIDPVNYPHWLEGADRPDRTVAGYRLGASGSGGDFFLDSHYSFVGLNPWEIADSQAPEGYFLRNARQVLANRGYCLYEAPEEYRYHQGWWGLGACLTPDGYETFSPGNDRGYVAPAAALGAFPYAPYFAMQVLAVLDGELRRMAWGGNGPYDAVNLADNWSAREYLAIDQLPIACMLENYRSGLLWDLFMGLPEVKEGLAKAGLKRPDLPAGFPEALRPLEPAEGGGYVEGNHVAVTHPEGNVYRIPYWADRAGEAEFALYDADGGVIWRGRFPAAAGRNWLEIPPDELEENVYPDAESAGADGWVLLYRFGNGDHRLPIEFRHMP